MPLKVVRPILLINNIDNTDRLTGNINIEIEEGRARIASFFMLQGSGISNLMSWVGADVIIKSVVNSVTKTEFSGVIDTPVYDIKTGLTQFSCTDNLQETFETKTQDEIAALIPNSYWSESAFNRSEGWEHAQERLSTLPKSLDFDENKAVRITPWAAKTTPDFIFNACIDGSLNVDQIAERRNIINKFEIELKYRYTRLKERQLVCDWDDNLGDQAFVCDREADYPLPKKILILDAISRTGWELITDVIWKELPNGSFTCGGVPVGFNGGTIYARGAAFSIGKRYTQNITELYKITVLSVDSINSLGEISINKSYASQTDYDTGDWNNSLISKGWDNIGIPQADINNDNYVNKDDDSSRQNSLNTAINIASTKILSTHRQNRVSFSVPYQQDIDVIHTAQITNSKLTAKGKVVKVVKAINTDPQNFSAETAITIALSKPFGTGIPDPDAPAETPDALPPAEDIQTVDTNLEYHLGGRDDTEFDPNWSGWITDYTFITEPGHTPYPTEFVIHTPAITLNSIDNIDPENESLYNVTIPDDVLQ